MISADGLFSGPNGETDWFVSSEDLNTYSLELLRSVDAILYGGRTYRMMADFWPEPPEEFVSRSGTLRQFAELTNEIPKLIATRSPNTPWGDWNNAQALAGTLQEEIQTIRSESGPDVVVYGSGTIVRQLTNLGLVDEYRLIVNPVILGEGNRLFDGADEVALKLVEAQVLSAGTIASRYVRS